MPLRLFVNGEPDDGKRFKDGDVRAERRAFCDGCGMGVAYQPHQFVYEPAQVDSWIAEHKEHGVDKGKGKS